MAADMVAQDFQSKILKANFTNYFSLFIWKMSQTSDTIDSAMKSQEAINESISMSVKESERFCLGYCIIQEVEEYKNSVKKKAEILVKEKFPERIIQCNKLLESSPFYCEDFSTIHTSLNIPVPEPHLLNNHNDDPPGKKRKMANSNNSDEDEVKGTKVFIIPSGSVSINIYITKMVDIIKPIIRTLVEDANLLKMWVAFLIPKIEDGNNFGVSIQEETLGEIRSVESEAAAFFDQISRYYMTRAKLISKVAKYPHIDDYRRTVQELDEKEYLSMRITLAELRNHYASLHDLITKNLEKIKKPRSANSMDAMY